MGNLRLQSGKDDSHNMATPGKHQKVLEQVILRSVPRRMFD